MIVSKDLRLLTATPVSSLSIAPPLFSLFSTIFHR